jgi:hypothetical protein
MEASLGKLSPPVAPGSNDILGASNALNQTNVLAHHRRR